MFLAPFEANILITGRCNLACRHCGVFSQGPLKYDLSISDWALILDRLVEARLFSLTITGGEPLVREDFPAFVREILKRPFSFSLNTNALLADDSIAALLAGAAPRLKVVMVSLDGDSPDTHDLIRGENAFRNAMDGVAALKRAGVPLCFYCTVTSLNIHRLVETAELALSLGRWIRFNCFLDAGPGTDSALNPSAEQVRRAAATVLELSERYPGRIAGALLEMARLGKLVTDGRGISFGPDSGPSCGGGRSKIAVMPDGWVTPCDHLPNIRFGSLLEGTLSEILTGPAATAFMDSNRSRTRTLEGCQECPISENCPGSCPAADCSQLTCMKNYLGTEA